MRARAPGATSRRGTSRRAALGGWGAALAAAVLLAAPAAAQHTLTAPSGREFTIPQEELLRMLDTTRALRADLEEDPRILYFLGTGPHIPTDRPDAAWPWNAVEVVTDSTAAVRTPGNLREAARAYDNYAVLRMRHVRGDPDVSCDELLAREVEAVAGFAAGWVVARALFGAPPYPPLDRLAAAREAGHLDGLLGHEGDRQLGGCLEVWRADHPERLEAYRRWLEGEEASGPAAARRPGGGPAEHRRASAL